VIHDVTRTNAIDGFRMRSVRGLARDGDQLREALDEFARARSNQVAG